MPIQKKVNKELALGVPGNFYDVTPRRVSSFISEANGANPVTFGYVCTADGENKAKVGGTGAILGVFVDTHSVPLFGGLQPSLQVPSGTPLGVASVGHIIVQVGAAVTHESSKPVYNTTTGAISAVASSASSAGDGFAFIPNAKFVFFDAEEGGVAVLELNGLVA